MPLLGEAFSSAPTGFRRDARQRYHIWFLAQRVIFCVVAGLCWVGWKHPYVLHLARPANLEWSIMIWGFTILWRMIVAVFIQAIGHLQDVILYDDFPPKLTQLSVFPSRGRSFSFPRRFD